MHWALEMLSAQAVFQQELVAARPLSCISPHGAFQAGPLPCYPGPQRLRNSGRYLGWWEEVWTVLSTGFASLLQKLVVCVGRTALLPHSLSQTTDTICRDSVPQDSPCLGFMAILMGRRWFLGLSYISVLGVCTSLFVTGCPHVPPITCEVKYSGMWAFPPWRLLLAIQEIWDLWGVGFGPYNSHWKHIEGKSCGSLGSVW